MENEEVKEVNEVVEPKIEAPHSMYDENTKPKENNQPLYEQVSQGTPLTADKVNQLFDELMKLQQNQQIIINQTKKEEVKVDNDDVIKY